MQSSGFRPQGRIRRSATLFALILLALVFVSCGHGALGAHRHTAAYGSRTAPKTVSLADVLRGIDAYPVPKGASSETWKMLVTELKKQLVARSVDGKGVLAAPVGSGCAVKNLNAVSDQGGHMATITWTERLDGDCNNDGQVDIADLQPIALHYGETSSGPGSAAYLADANGDGQVGITDLQPIAADYSMHLQGYRLYRGRHPMTVTIWESSFRPNVGNPVNADWSIDRAEPPPVSARPSFSYLDDIDGLADKTCIRYKVYPFGDGALGAVSNEAMMSPPYGFAVSGRVADGLGGGVGGALLTLSPGGQSAATQPDGSYVISGASDGSYTVTPTMTGWSFAPTGAPVTVAGADVTGVDFVAAEETYSVSGAVLESGVGLAGVTMTLTPGGLNATTQVDGTFTIAGVHGGSYTLTPDLPGYTFTPTDRAVTVAGADVTGQDFAATSVSQPKFKVSGSVAPPVGIGISGALMTLTPGGYNATTGPTGLYDVLDVPNGTYTLTPTKDGYFFTPPARTVVVDGADEAGQNFVGERGGLSGSPWPKFMQNNRNTGLSTHLGAQSNTLKWKFDNGSGNIVSSPSIAEDGTIFCGDWNDYVFALNPADGSLKWRYQTGDMIYCSPTVAWDGTVYIGSLDGYVYALNPANGNVIWNTYTDSVWSAPAIAADGTVYVGSSDYYVYALNPTDGSVKWACPTGGVIKSSPAIGMDGTIYIGSYDYLVYAINPDGSVKWTRATSGVVESSPAVGADGTIYVGSCDHDVYALNPTDGSVKWQTPTDALIDGSPGIGPDGTVYIGSRDHYVYALNQSDGSVKWKTLTDFYVTSSPAIASDGTVYIGGWDGYLYALEPAGGSVKWKYQTSGWVESSPAIASDGTIYVGSQDCFLYAIGP